MAEDTIELKNIRIPEPQVDVDLEGCGAEQGHSDGEGPSSLHLAANLISMSRTKSVPSLSTLVSAKKEMEDQDDKVTQHSLSHFICFMVNDKVNASFVSIYIHLFVCFNKIPLAHVCI